MDVPVKMRVLGFILHDLLGDLLFMTIANCGPNIEQPTDNRIPGSLPSVGSLVDALYPAEQYPESSLNTSANRLEGWRHSRN